MINMLENLVYKVLGNSDGIKLLEELKTILFRETARDSINTNDFIFIDGKRQLVRDLMTIINQQEIVNERNK